MKKGFLKKILFTLVLMVTLLPIKNLKAASGHFNVTTSSSEVQIGGYAYVTVTVSSDSPLGSWEYTISYDESKLKLEDGQAHVASYGDGTKKSESYTYQFKVIASGTSTVSVISALIIDFDTESPIDSPVSSTSITGYIPQNLEANYSSNNNLKNLEVSGYKISPEFNKDKTEYTVEVPESVEKVTINAEVEDSTARITGTGEHNVSEGENKFEIVVTAENGSTKKYTIKVTVKDSNPIEVTIDGLKYTVVKRESSLTAPSSFEKTKVSINGNEVPGFKSKITNITLIGLKDKNGKINLYKYDSKTDSYTIYTELKTNTLTIFPITPKKSIIPTGYKTVELELNGTTIEALQYENNKDFYLIYGINIETGKEDLYEYDKENNTIIKYNNTNEQQIKKLTEENENYKLIIIILCIETLTLVLIVLINLTKRNKRKTKKELKKEETSENLNVKEESTKTSAKEEKQEPKEETKNNKKEEKDKK